MGKRKREDDDDYVEFCHDLQQHSRDGVGDTSYIYSSSRLYKRPRINPNFYKPAAVEYRYLDRNDLAYQEIARLITNRSIVIDDIVEVQNTALEQAYNLKKEQKLNEYGQRLKEELLFHGTRECNVGSICRFNFDWRLTGSNKGHKFGKGICFSRNAKYASSYSDPDKHYKVMIVAKVLIARICRGHHDMSIPPQGFDTSQKGQSGVVLVKYEDNEFYPAYILYYHFNQNGHRQYETISCNCNRHWCSHRHYDRYRDHSGEYYSHQHYYDFSDYDYNYSRDQQFTTHYDRRNEHFYNSQDCSNNYSYEYDGEYQESSSYFSFD